MEYEKIDDLKHIKKEYGENMMHLCRSLFPTILDTPGALYHILSTHFAKSKSLYGDITREFKEYLFKEYIYHFFDNDKEKVTKSNKTVKELLDEAGYELFECKNNDDIQKFKKYYAPDEELCTFKDPHRINTHYIFFIVKKDVDKIIRKNFNNPEREDEYGTSVLDLQFDQGSTHRVSIKCRYNHSVLNPDATYSNNLDSIAAGLTDAFESEYGFNIGYESTLGFELDHYQKARDGKFYKYNYEIDNVHYCPNNIIMDNGNIIYKYTDKSRYLIMDYFILDMSERKIFLYDKFFMNESFIDDLKNITNIKITNEDKCKKVELTLNGTRNAIIKLDNQNRIIEYANEELKKAGPMFLSQNVVLKKLDVPKLEQAGNHFLYLNEKLSEINAPSLKKCGNGFIPRADNIEVFNAPKLEEVGDGFLMLSYSTSSRLDFPSLKKCGDGFLQLNNNIRVFNAPKLEEVGINFLEHNIFIEKLDLPNLKYFGNGFLRYNMALKEINAPNVHKADVFTNGSQKLKFLLLGLETDRRFKIK